MGREDLRLLPTETQIVGSWILEHGRVVGDDACERIDGLVTHQLRRVCDHPVEGAWEILFVDPGDGRLWVKTHPKSAMHGGGPPALVCISTESAIREFGDVVIRLTRKP